MRLLPLPPIVVFEAHNIVLTQISARLHPDHLQRQLAGILHLMLDVQWTRCRLVLCDSASMLSASICSTIRVAAYAYVDGLVQYESSSGVSNDSNVALATLPWRGEVVLSVRSIVSLITRFRLLVVFCSYALLFVMWSILTEQPDRLVQQTSSSSAIASVRGFQNHCAACHVGEGRAVGPDLNGVVGRRAGTLPGFEYSSAMRARNIIWTKDNIVQFLRSPATFVPGTTMAVGNIDQRDANEIANSLTRFQ